MKRVAASIPAIPQALLADTFSRLIIISNKNQGCD
jgi:hypothetical protein